MCLVIYPSMAADKSGPSKEGARMTQHARVELLVVEIRHPRRRSGMKDP